MNPHWDRFMSKVRRTDDGCWEWMATTTKGYGRFSVGGVLVRAHRWSYEQLVGPIPEGLQLDHLCRNRGCVNPDHLEPVTCRENLLRGDTFNARNIAKTHCPQGHEYTPENTFVKAGRRNCRACHRESSRRYAASLKAKETS